LLSTLFPFEIFVSAEPLLLFLRAWFYLPH
jgi:hypothetical protein